jgi:hypothetical protein
MVICIHRKGFILLLHVLFGGITVLWDQKSKLNTQTIKIMARVMNNMVNEPD